ncbi:protein CASC1-like [Asbolus verrucosus]|uniref:Protein CASC1-like n=1 Tax=Asbolus verrucosus TaxID=1661398 RepID=A0A482WB78_ASBVE|nr:protein CASC1-like [Asbolus verrucosus]
MGKKKGKNGKIKDVISASAPDVRPGSSAELLREPSSKILATSSKVLPRRTSSRGQHGRKSKSKTILPVEEKKSFSSSSLSSDASFSYEEIVEEQEVIVPAVFKRDKRGKKGKKGKKDKKKKKEEGEAEAEPAEEDIVMTISKMKLLAEAQIAEEAEAEAAAAEEPEKKKKKKKKGPKKKLSKKEKARIAAELAEKARQNTEEELARQAELERIRLEEERKAAIEKEKRETFEHQIRTEQLEASLDYLNRLISHNKSLRDAAKARAEWDFYVDCGRLPNPSRCDQMNTFLHLWENTVEETTMEEAAKRTEDVLQLLDDLDNLIDTAEEPNSEIVQNWRWVRLLFRQQQAKSLDVATYRLLRDIEKNLHRIDIPTADYKYQDDNIALCLWLRVQLPTPLPNPRRPPKPRIEIEFPEMKMEVQFPLTIDGDKIAIRALYVKYDHLSDLSATYQKPLIPEQYDKGNNGGERGDLHEAMRLEWREKLLYKYENRVRKPPPPPPEKEEGEEGGDPVEEWPPPEPVIGPDDEVPVVPYRKLEPTASEYVITKEDVLYSSVRSGLVKTVEEDVINLRKYSIIGGVYTLNLVHQPPQPQDFVTMEMTLTPLDCVVEVYLPKQLELVDFYVPYTPMTADLGKRLPEEIEEEMKKQEEELDKLILITVTWPEHVIFLELPMVCHWDHSRGVWTKREVHDLKHNEEKGSLSFRTGRCGTFALATYRYANLPYQAWELRPEANGTATLQITAAILMVEFNVKDGAIALSQLQNSPNNALQDAVGVYHPLPKLIRTMQSSGVDVFPAFDSFCYIENTCEKHWPMEKHLYFNMAQSAVCFNFASSRWNLPAGRRGAVLQMREYNVEKTKQKNHSMLHVTPLSAVYVDCTEVSPAFNEEGVENMKVIRSQTLETLR